MESSDPTVVRSIAVTAEDVVSALEMNESSPEHAVLRVTPPFSGRMRARLHVTVEGEYDQQPAPLHVDPETLLADPPSYPRPADTEDELRNDPEESYTVDRHHERHREAVQEWRDAVAATIRDRAELATDEGDQTVSVTVLGEPATAE
jgi:hypothetical protein